jgi:TolA-binding protein
VRQAEHLGVEGCLASARSVDLSALADAARYGRHDELARGALLAQRRRFAMGRAARDAAFLLGKLEETDQNPAAAIGWYDRYMREDAKGPYASDALGRKMILVQQLYGDAQARSVAAEYLNRFPDGAYVSRARALTRTP